MSDVPPNDNGQNSTTRGNHTGRTSRDVGYRLVLHLRWLVHGLGQDHPLGSGESPVCSDAFEVSGWRS